MITSDVYDHSLTPQSSATIVMPSSLLNFLILTTLPQLCFLFFFFNDPATTEISPLSLHDALPICGALGLEVHAELLGKPLVGGDRARAIPAAVEQRDQLAQRSLLMGGELDRPPRPVGRGLQVIHRLVSLDQRLRAAGGRLLQPCALRFQPALELRGA